jgi:hypothetical protein
MNGGVLWERPRPGRGCSVIYGWMVRNVGLLGSTVGANVPWLCLVLAGWFLILCICRSFKDTRIQNFESNVVKRSALFWCNAYGRLVRNYHPRSTLRNIPEERRYLHRDGRLKSRMMLGCSVQNIKTTSLQPFVIRLLQSVSDSISWKHVYSYMNSRRWIC